MKALIVQWIECHVHWYLASMLQDYLALGSDKLAPATTMPASAVGVLGESAEILARSGGSTSNTQSQQSGPMNGSPAVWTCIDMHEDAMAEVLSGSVYRTKMQHHDAHARRACLALPRPTRLSFGVVLHHYELLAVSHRVRDAWPMSSLHVQATVPLFTSRGRDLSELGSAPGTTVKLYTATAYLGLSQRAVVKLINTGEIAATCGRGNCWEVDITSLRAYKQKGYPRAS